MHNYLRTYVRHDTLRCKLINIANILCRSENIGLRCMGTCHPMATLKYIDSFTSFPVNIKLRYKQNWQLAILQSTPQIIKYDKVIVFIAFYLVIIYLGLNNSVKYVSVYRIMQVIIIFSHWTIAISVLKKCVYIHKLIQPLKLFQRFLLFDGYNGVGKMREYNKRLKGM